MILAWDAGQESDQQKQTMGGDMGEVGAGAGRGGTGPAATPAQVAEETCLLTDTSPWGSAALGAWCLRVGVGGKEWFHLCNEKWPERFSDPGNSHLTGAKENRIRPYYFCDGFASPQKELNWREQKNHLALWPPQINSEWFPGLIGQASPWPPSSWHCLTLASFALEVDTPFWGVRSSSQKAGSPEVRQASHPLWPVPSNRPLTSGLICPPGFHREQLLPQTTTHTCRHWQLLTCDSLCALMGWHLTRSLCVDVWRHSLPRAGFGIAKSALKNQNLIENSLFKSSFPKRKGWVSPQGTVLFIAMYIYCKQ